ncbi:Olfactory receptor 52R1 [Chelonia mydas]|uniref:Olfactory receptor 52R1 n=1 Tax=Chelonia mydas TaxID=8469 RepID=M7CIV5_CHEMY|nr:Olfactory receptor 52R1 [Chelonia mydas]
MSCPTCSDPAAFLLVIILGLQEAQFWITFPFCIMYVIAVLGNVIVFCIIKTESSLQELMHLFLAMLAITDLVLSMSTLPQKLSIFWLGSREIAFHACLTQMFFVHSISSVDSGMLLALALDHYMLPFCQRCLISHSYCKHMAVVKLRCGDATAFSTCTSLLCVVLAYYSPGLFIFLTHPFGLNVPHHVHILVANLCGCPPMPNPVVYGVKTKQIRERVLRIFNQKGI